MLKRVATIVSLALVASSPLRAQVLLDVSKVTCWQFATYKVANPQFIAIWVSGYHQGKRGDTVVDTERLVANADKLSDYCTKNPDIPLMQAVETVFGSSN